MRYSCNLLMAAMFVVTQLYSQEPSKLVMPATPAFSILDYEPTSIMRPTNVKSVSSDLLSSFDEQGKLLMNLGLEASPYWLGSHPKLKMNTYLNPNVGQTILQSLQISAATVKYSSSGDNKLGAGFRFKVFNGKPAQKEIAAANRKLKTRTTVVSIIIGIKSIVSPGVNDTKQTALDAITNILTVRKFDKSIIEEVKNAADEIEAEFPETVPGVQAFLDQLAEDFVGLSQDIQTGVSELLYQRQGLIVEFAGASGYNTSQNYSLEKAGFWGNASYYISADDLFSLTTRYMFRHSDTSLTNFDAGIGYLKKNNKYNVSVESMLRWYNAEIPDINSANQPIRRVEKKFTYRLAAQGAYFIGKDISLNISLGKDFDDPFISGQGFFSILGLNYSIFSKEPATLK